MHRVLLIGKRASVLTRLQSALRAIRIECDLTQDVTGASPDLFRRYDAVAFGRAVGEADRTRMKAAFKAVNPPVVFVDGLAPITPLLVAQFEQALAEGGAADGPLGDVAASRDRVDFQLRTAARVRVLTYDLTFLYRTRTRLLLDQRLEAGGHRLPLDHRRRWVRDVFAVLRADNQVRVIRIPQ
jgi:hypothetical protein